MSWEEWSGLREINPTTTTLSGKRGCDWDDDWGSGEEAGIGGGGADAGTGAGVGGRARTRREFGFGFWLRESMV